MRKYLVSALGIGNILDKFRVERLSEAGPSFLEQLSQYHSFHDLRGSAQ
jgi:hypothetical protein